MPTLFAPVPVTDAQRLLQADRRRCPRGLAIHVVLDNLSAHKAPEIARWLPHRDHRRWHLHFAPPLPARSINDEAQRLLLHDSSALPRPYSLLATGTLAAMTVGMSTQRTRSSSAALGSRRERSDLPGRTHEPLRRTQNLHLPQRGGAPIRCSTSERPSNEVVHTKVQAEVKTNQVDKRGRACSAYSNALQEISAAAHVSTADRQGARDRPMVAKDAPHGGIIAREGIASAPPGGYQVFECISPKDAVGEIRQFAPIGCEKCAPLPGPRLVLPEGNRWKQPIRAFAFPHKRRKNHAGGWVLPQCIK
jgi:hypothetical protein